MVQAQNEEEKADLAEIILYGVEHLKKQQNQRQGDTKNINLQREFINQYNLIGLFFAEPFDFSSRIWGSVIQSMQREFPGGGNTDTKFFGCILVPLLRKYTNISFSNSLISMLQPRSIYHPSSCKMKQSLNSSISAVRQTVQSSL